MMLLLCDIDNTLIHSYKNAAATDICVGILNDRKQDFMSYTAYKLLATLPTDITLVPMTTRSIRQYRRIQWPEGCKPKYAVVSNGANLLINGEVSEEWHHRSESLIAPYYGEMERLERKGFSIIDDAYCVSEVVDDHDSTLDVFKSSRRVTLTPPTVNKGVAAIWLREMLERRLVLAAGDSKLDVPMLCSADVAIVPNADLVVRGPKYTLVSNKPDFAAFTLSSAWKLLNHLNGVCDVFSL